MISNSNNSQAHKAIDDEYAQFEIETICNGNSVLNCSVGGIFGFRGCKLMQ